MKRSKLYKGFVPVDFTKKQEVIKNIGNKRGVVYLIIINLILLPINIKSLMMSNDKELYIKDRTNNINYNTNKERINNDLKLFDYNIDEIAASEKETTVITKDESIIYKLNKNDFNISRIEINEAKIKITIKDE